MKKFWETIKAKAKAGQSMAGTFYITMLIWFLVWLTNGWIFIMIILLPLFLYVKRKIKAKKAKKNESIS